MCVCVCVCVCVRFTPRIGQHIGLRMTRLPAARTTSGIFNVTRHNNNREGSAVECSLNI